MALPSSSLRVECLSQGVDDSALLENFQDFGAIHAVVIKHKETGTSQVIAGGVHALDRNFSAPCPAETGLGSYCCIDQHFTTVLSTDRRRALGLSHSPPWTMQHEHFVSQHGTWVRLGCAIDCRCPLSAQLP